MRKHVNPSPMVTLLPMAVFLVHTGCGSLQADTDQACADLCAWGEKCAPDFWIPPYVSKSQCTESCQAGHDDASHECMQAVLDLETCYQDHDCYDVPAANDSAAGCETQYFETHNRCVMGQDYPPQVRICYDTQRRIYERCP